VADQDLTSIGGGDAPQPDALVTGTAVPGQAAEALDPSEGVPGAAAPKAPAKQAPATRAPAAQAPAKKAPAKQAPAKRATAAKDPAAKAPAKKAAAKRATAAKAPATKAPAAKAPAAKAPAAKAPATKAPAAKAPAAGATTSPTDRTRTSGRKRAAAKRTARTVAGAAGAVVDRAGGAIDSATAAARGYGSEGPVVPPKRLSGFDFATWRTASADPAMRSPIIGLVALDSSPDWDRLVARFDRASRVAPVLRQKVLEGPADILSPRLVIDPDFDLSFHMRRFRVAEPGSWDQVLDETRRQSMTDFDLARPLWRVTLLEGLQGGRAALIVKLHHAIADGQGAMMLGATVIDLTPADQDLGPLPPAPVPAPMDTAAFLGTAMADASSFLVKAAKEAADTAVPIATRALTDPMGAAEDVAHVLKSVARFLAVPSRPMSPLMTGRSINYHFVTFELPLAELKAAAKPHGLSLNDAFIAAVMGGLRIYHERRDEPVAELRCNMPISLRNPERPAQNAVTIARFEVPVGIVDPVERMHAVRRIVDGWKREPALHLADPLAEVGTRIMPLEILTSAAQKSDFTASNVPGVPMPVWIAGAQVLAMYPMVGTIGAATNITLLSYAGRASLGISMDDAAIPDRELFVECLGAGLAEVVGHHVTTSDPLA
jgi:WS/DGAT/MGAT family acyltransferase